MRTNADLNRIIDKIAAPQPARFDASSLSRDEKTRSSDAASPQPRRAETPNAVDKKAAVSPFDGENASRPFPPRLAVDSSTRSNSARGRRRSSTPASAPRRFADANGAEEKIGKTVKIPANNVKKRGAEDSDDENKRTQRRRQIDPTTCERDYSADEIEFMKALDDYKRASGRMFPTCSEILEVFKSLGYVKIARSEAPERSSSRNAKPRRAATPAFLGDEENEPFDFEDAPVPGVA